MILRMNFPAGGYALELRAPDSLEGGLEVHLVDVAEYADDPDYERRLWEDLGLTRAGEPVGGRVPFALRGRRRQAVE
jgi:hypothetical protein